MKYLLILPIIFLCSCVSLDKDFVRSVDDGVKKIVPNYILYIEGDPAISPELKEARKLHAEELLKLIEDAKKLAGVE